MSRQSPPRVSSRASASPPRRSVAVDSRALGQRRLYPHASTTVMNAIAAGTNVSSVPCGPSSHPRRSIRPITTTARNSGALVSATSPIEERVSRRIVAASASGPSDPATGPARPPAGSRVAAASDRNPAPGPAPATPAVRNASVNTSTKPATESSSSAVASPTHPRHPASTRAGTRASDGAVTATARTAAAVAMSRQCRVTSCRSDRTTNSVGVSEASTTDRSSSDDRAS
jgi:hypothetical protein